MAQLVLGATGAAIGFMVGGPLGAQLGWGLGATLGASLGPGQHSEGNRLADLRAPKIEYGARWPRIYGRVRVAGIRVWMSDAEEVPTTTEQGGKGGPSVSSTTYTYYRSAFFGFSEYHFGAAIKPVAVTRIWRNGKLVWSALSPSAAAALGASEEGILAVAETLAASAETPQFDSQEFFDGNPAQLPWSVYEAAVGTANAQALRGRAGMGLTRINCGSLQDIGYWEFEVVTKATGAFEPAGGYVGATAGSGYSMAMPDGIAAGDSLVAYILHRNTAAIPAFANGWGTYIDAAQESSSSTRLHFFTRTASGTPDDDLADFTVASDGGGPALWAVVAFRGQVDAQWPGDLTISGSGGDSGNPNSEVEVGETTLNPGQLTKSAGDQFLMAVAFAVAPLEGGAVIGSAPSDCTAAASATAPLTFSGDPTEYKMQLSVAYKTYTGTVGNPKSFSDGTGYYGSGGNGTLSFAVTYRATPGGITPGTEDLADIVAQEHLRANGGDASEFDVSELVGIPVIGVAFAGTARAAIEQLMAAYYFGAVCSDKVYYRRRGAAAVKTIPFEDTAAGENAPTATPFVGPARDSAAEIPAKVAVAYTNLNADYDAGSEEGDRVVSASNEIRQVQLDLVTTADRAKGIADTIAADGYFAAQRCKAQVDDSYAELEPGDVNEWTDDAGNLWRMRTEDLLYSGGAFDHQLVRDDASILSEVGITAGGYTPSLVVPRLPATELVLLDVPIERDADDGPGGYAAMKPTTGSLWEQGADLVESLDGSTWAQDGQVLAAATIGTTSDALGGWAGGTVFDSFHSFTVDVGDATLSSVTFDAAIADPTLNLAWLGAHGRWEGVQYLTATLVSTNPNVYTVRDLLRGRRGTEHLTGTHQAGDVFVKAAAPGTAGTLRVVRSNGQLNVDYSYKGVTRGRNRSTATAQSFAFAGVGVLPFSPFDVRKTVDEATGDITFTWQRRTRRAVRVTGPLPISVPLGEDREAYSLDLFTDATFATVLRTLADTETTSAVYTAAQQAADGYVANTPNYVHVHQLSAVVGRGTAAEATL